MDIDAAPLQPLAGTIGKDLHVAREHQQLSPARIEQIEHARLLPQLPVRLDRVVVEGQLVPLRQPGVRVVVRYDAGDVDRQRPNAPAMQQTVETVSLLRYGDQDLASMF